ncbi:MAG: RHS repeat-associated core domain-containing protein, partial [Geobacteraceae bacterium]|nr:RHS repeat-associated core domain-containing protein [Geobacteraceae bacterium]
MTVHEYDELERRTATTDALGRTTRFDYDAFGLLLSATDHAGRVTGYRYDNKGLLNRVEHADGRKSTWEFDQRNNLVSTTDPDGSTYRYSYDDRGNPVAETGPDGAVTRWEYDHGIRLSAQIDPLGNRTTMEEDAWGRLRSITNAAGNTTRFEYDPSPENPRADMSRIIHPDGGEECFTYDREGLPATHVAQEGQETRYSHGAFDLLRSITDARGYTTKLDYDGAARLKGITNAQGQKWSLSYDPAGNLAVETDWAGRQTRYVRDAIGRVISKRLPDGVEQRLTWDEQDRIAAVDTEKQRISYEYDNSDRLVRASTFGKENEERESDLQFVYDDKGWLAKEIQNGIDFEYAYDASGRCISRTSPTGATRYGFDKAGQLKGLESNGHSLDFTRDERGLETQRQYRAEDKKPLDAFTLKQSYDPCGRLKRQLAGRERQLSTHERLAEVSRRYRLDKSGRLIGISDNKRGSSSYHYDPRDQVTGIIRQTGLNKHVEERFSYDELLNLAESSGQSHRYRDGTVRAIGPTSYRYDVRGRVTEKRIERNGFRPKTWRYLWDDFDRLVETRTPDGAVWRYTYDAFGRRIRKECLKAGESGKQLSTYYFWQGATLIEEWETDPREDDSLLATTRWHFEPGTFNPVAKETRTVSGKEDTEANFHLIVTDHLGTPKEMFDADGECLWQADQELWGRTTVKPLKTRPDSHLPLVGCSLRFQNQWEDAETGLFYNLNRYYDPDSGQYLSPDPIGLEGGLRTHGYVHDPMQWVDPLGLCKNSIFKTGANITPRSVAVKYRIIGRGGRTFVTTPEAITKIIGKLPKGNRIRITNAQARQLENELGLIPKSLESRNILSIVRDIPKRTPASPISGNVIFKGGGNGLPGGGPEITIQGIPSAGGPGIRQIIVEVEP